MAGSSYMPQVLENIRNLPDTQITPAVINHRMLIYSELVSFESCSKFSDDDWAAKLKIPLDEFVKNKFATFVIQHSLDTLRARGKIELIKENEPLFRKYLELSKSDSDETSRKVCERLLEEIGRLTPKSSTVDLNIHVDPLVDEFKNLRRNAVDADVVDNSPEIVCNSVDKG